MSDEEELRSWIRKQHRDPDSSNTNEQFTESKGWVKRYQWRLKRKWNRRKESIIVRTIWKNNSQEFSRREEHMGLKKKTVLRKIYKNQFTLTYVMVKLWSIKKKSFQKTSWQKYYKGMTIRQVAGISIIKEPGSDTFKMLRASNCELHFFT